MTRPSPSVLAGLRCALGAAALCASAAHADFPTPFDRGAVYSRELTVATTGSDSTGTGSADRPFATLARALAAVTPGTRVRVRSGTYGPVGSARNLQGTASEPIAIVADGTVLIDAGRASGVSAWHVSDARYLVIEGFTIQNTAVHGLNIDDGSDGTPAEHVVLRNLRFRAIGSGDNNDCLKLSGIDHFHVEGSEFEGCNRGEGIDMVGCHDGFVTGNHFHDLPANAVGAKGGSADVLIHGNRFVNITHRGVNAGGSTGADYFRPLSAAHEATRIRIVANTFERTSPPVAFVGCLACVFAHNTVIEPRRWLARILEENTARAAGRDGLIVNNVIVFTGRLMADDYVDVGGGTRPATFTVGSNLWYSLDNPRFRGAPLGAGIPAETGSLIQRDPRFVDRAARDFHLRPDSPAIGSGRELPVEVAGDLERRAYGAPPTLGAFTEPVRAAR